MKNAVLISFLCLIISSSYPQNISVDRPERILLGMELKGDTSVYLCRSEQKDSPIFPLFFKKDSIAWQGRTFFDTKDFDAVAQRIYSGSGNVKLAGYELKKKAGVRLKKSFSMRVGMLPTFGHYIGKKKPGRHKQIGYQVKIKSEGAWVYEGYVCYYFQKQSFFKRFFKKHRLKKRLRKLPVIAGADGPEVIFKNDMIQEGGQVKEIYHTFKLKE